MKTLLNIMINLQTHRPKHELQSQQNLDRKKEKLVKVKESDR